MSITRHFDALTVYGASAMRLLLTEGEPEDMLGDGGLLGDRFEEIGRSVLLSVLADASVAGVLLADGDLSIEVGRTGAGARFQVKWGSQPVVDEHVEIPVPLDERSGPLFRPELESEIKDLTVGLHDVEQRLVVCQDISGSFRYFTRGKFGAGLGQWAVTGVVPAVEPSSLGSRSFREEHGVRLAYVAGAMAGGIASSALVIAMGKAGLIGFLGAGGLPLEAVERSLKEIVDGLKAGESWGANLLNNPHEPEVEEGTVDLYLKYGVKRVSASAYMGLSPAVVRYRLHGIYEDASGQVCCPNKVFAKISRPEVAEKFMRPAPDKLLQEMVKNGKITAEQAALAKRVPVAADITAEADSGGHTDHRPALVLLPIIQQLRDRITEEQGFAQRGVQIRVGLAGGLGEPTAVWAAFAMGADFVLTGSVNQAAVEAGTSNETKNMLQAASYTDVSSGPAPDMFEMGAKVQVLSRGSMYAQRAQRLYDLYKRFHSMEEIPAKDRAKIEKQLFKKSLDEVWQGTKEYWQGRDPEQVARAEKDPHYKMALTFRWYLGMTSRWARMGDSDRKRDYQIWCGPAIGGFNEWVAGTALEDVANRRVGAIAEALMHGASIQARMAYARALGVSVPTLRVTVGS